MNNVVAPCLNPMTYVELFSDTKDWVQYLLQCTSSSSCLHATYHIPIDAIVFVNNGSQECGCGYVLRDWEAIFFSTCLFINSNICTRHRPSLLLSLSFINAVLVFNLFFIFFISNRQKRNKKMQ